MKDVQKQKSEIDISLDLVGIKDIEYPVALYDKVNKKQNTVAKISMYVNVPKTQKGTHMSRFIELINENKEIYLDSERWESILIQMKETFKCKRSQIEVKAPYFLKKKAPVSKKESLMKIDCRFIYGHNGKKVRIIEVKVPVTSLCPCSKEISEYGAHNQRSYVVVQFIYNKFVWIEDIVNLIEECASCPIYPLLKRLDEKYVTERAYDNPVFVEDLVRKVSKKLIDLKKMKWFRVKAENCESIHDHNVFAVYEWGDSSDVKKLMFGGLS